MAAPWSRVGATAMTLAALWTTVPPLGSLTTTPATQGSESPARAASMVALAVNPNLTDDRPVLEFVPGELWLGKVSRGRAYPIVQSNGEPIGVHNATDRPVTVSLRPVRLTATSDAVCSGSREMLDWASVHLHPTHMTLAPGETAEVHGMVRMTKAKPPRDGTLAFLIECQTEASGEARAIYARVYAPTRARP